MHHLAPLAIPLRGRARCAAQLQASLLPQLAGGRVVKALLRADEAARQREQAKVRLPAAADEQHRELAHRRMVSTTRSTVTAAGG